MYVLGTHPIRTPWHSERCRSLLADKGGNMKPSRCSNAVAGSTVVLRQIKVVSKRRVCVLSSVICISKIQNSFKKNNNKIGKGNRLTINDVHMRHNSCATKRCLGDPNLTSTQLGTQMVELIKRQNVCNSARPYSPPSQSGLQLQKNICQVLHRRIL